MYSRILVPLDGSSYAEQALLPAIAIAQAAAATLYLVQVHEPIIPSSLSTWGIDGIPNNDLQEDAEQRGYEQAYLDALAQKTAQTAAITVEPVILDGSVTEQLVAYAAQQAIDLVVMTTHGRSGFARVWLGSNADAFVRHSHIPVLLVRPHEGLYVIDSKHPIERIVIPLDGSPLAEQVIPSAVALGTLSRAEMTLLMVVQPFNMPTYAPLAATAEVAQKATEEACADAKSYLEEVATKWRAQGARIQTRVILDPLPARAILRDAREHAVDVIAMATHGRGGIARMLVGSVADKVMRAADALVLLERPCHSKQHISTATETLKSVEQS
jgi:nucleotide-binding universal stress UspA family protein